MTEKRFDLGQIYEDNYDLVYRSVLHKFGNPNFAEDVTAETFVRAARYIETNFDGRNVRAWLCKIAYHTAINYKRKERDVPFDHTHSHDWDSKLATSREELHLQDPETMVANREGASELVKALRRIMPAEFLSTYLLRERDDRAYKEIAEIQGVAIGTVMSRLHRARKIIEEKLPSLERRILGE